MRALFAQDPQRFEKFSLRFGETLFDYSKNRITEETMRLLFDLARTANVEDWRERMFRGENINTSEDRAALHVALRNVSDHPIRSEEHTSELQSHHDLVCRLLLEKKKKKYKKKK